MQTGQQGWGKAQDSFLPPPPKRALSLTHDPLCVLSMDTWWNFGHELKKKRERETYSEPARPSWPPDTISGEPVWREGAPEL